MKVGLCHVLVEGHCTVTARGVRDTPGSNEPKQESRMRDHAKQ